jgi:sec-independent protein translocase protein TatA
MPQVGPLEILIVGVLALLVFGPERLPEIGRSLGKGLTQLKRMASDVKSEFDFGLEEEKAAAKPTGEVLADPVVDSDPRRAEMTNGSVPSA